VPLEAQRTWVMCTYYLRFMQGTKGRVGGKVQITGPGMEVVLGAGRTLSAV
jgi:hypothetical protein